MVVYVVLRQHGSERVREGPTMWTCEVNAPLQFYATGLDDLASLRSDDAPTPVLGAVCYIPRLMILTDGHLYPTPLLQSIALKSIHSLIFTEYHLPLYRYKSAIVLCFGCESALLCIISTRSRVKSCQQYSYFINSLRHLTLHQSLLSSGISKFIR